MQIRKVIVDADACPRSCLEIIRNKKNVYGFELLTVASINHVIDNENHIIVGSEPDAADYAIVNNTDPGDIIVTQDYGLAALVLAREAFALSPSGYIYSNDNIEQLLEHRSLMARYRRMGGKTKGPKKRTKSDNKKFEMALTILLQNDQWRIGY